MKVRRIDFYPDDWLAGTAGMPGREKSVYWDICSLIYSRGGPIPDDEKWLSKVCGYHWREFRAIKESLQKAGKIVSESGHIAVKRCSEELQKALTIRSKASQECLKNGSGMVQEPVKNGSGMPQERLKSTPDSNEINDISNPRARGFLPSPSSSTSTSTSIKEEAEANASATRARQATHDAFDCWWQAYPHKIGKAAAEKAFTKALAKTSLDALLAGVECYKTAKPPDRSWCNPATWLNQDRWLDAPAPTLEIINGGLSNGPTRGQPGSFARAVEESRRAVFELNDRDRQRALAAGDQRTDCFDFDWPNSRVR